MLLRNEPLSLHLERAAPTWELVGRGHLHPQREGAPALHLLSAEEAPGERRAPPRSAVSLVHPVVHHRWWAAQRVVGVRAAGAPA